MPRVERKSMNKTALWLDGECRKGLIETLNRYLRKSPMLRRESPDEIDDHVSRALEIWIRRDSFAEAIEEGNPPSRSQLGSWAARTAANTIRDRGTDAHSRVVFGSRTVTERTTGLQRCVHAPAVHVQVLQGQDESNKQGEGALEICALTQRDAEALLIDGDIRRSVVAALEQQSPRSTATAARLSRVWDMMTHGESQDAISDELGVSRLRAVHLTGQVRERLRQAEISVKEALDVLAGVQDRISVEDAVSGQTDARKLLHGLESRGYVQRAVKGGYQITRKGILRLSKRDNGWWDRLVL